MRRGEGMGGWGDGGMGVLKVEGRGEEGRERTFFTGGVEVEAFDEVVHSDASALKRGRPGWWRDCWVRAGCAVRRGCDFAVALELLELRSCSWPGIALIDLIVLS